MTACGDPLVDKTDNSQTYISCDIVTHIYTPDEFLDVVDEIDDNAVIETTLEGSVVVSVEVCTEIANSTDDDVIEPDYDGGTL